MNIDVDLLDAVCRVVKAAGQIIQKISVEGFDTDYKERMDPVTSADRAANDYLQEHLLQVIPQAGWLSEETRDSEERLGRDLVWIVDPMDGTKEYVEHIPQYAVSVALAEKGEIVLGVVYNPAKHTCFSAVRGAGAWLNESPIQVAHPSKERLLILGSRSEIKRGEFQTFEKNHHVEAIGSIAYKLALIAAGYANTTFSLGPKNEWDIAAGVLLVEEAGGRVTDKAGENFTFNRKNTLVNGIIASTAGDYQKVRSLLHHQVYQGSMAGTVP